PGVRRPPGRAARSLPPVLDRGRPREGGRLADRGPSRRPGRARPGNRGPTVAGRVRDAARGHAVRQQPLDPAQPDGVRGPPRAGAPPAPPPPVAGRLTLFTFPDPA